MSLGIFRKIYLVLSGEHFLGHHPIQTSVQKSFAFLSHSKIDTKSQGVEFTKIVISV